MREPESEWIALCLEALFEEAGVGMAESALLDERGPLGRVLSTRIANPRCRSAARAGAGAA